MNQKQQTQKRMIYKPLDEVSKPNRCFTNMEAEAIKYMRQTEDKNPNRLAAWLYRNFFVQYTTQGVPIEKWNEGFEYADTFFLDCAMVFTGQRNRRHLPYCYAKVSETKTTKELYDYIVLTNTRLPLIIWRAK